jgi:protein gp37
MGDLFDPQSRYEWIDLIFDTMKRCPQHIFQILTKRPEALDQFSFPGNCWVGISIDGKYQKDGVENLLFCDASVKFISFEPLLAPVETPLEGIDWVIIGGQSRTPWNPKFTPPKEWVQPIIAAAKKHNIPVYIKDNAGWPEEIKEFPKRKAEHEASSRSS